MVGDVGYYVSPLAGFGASLAIIGAGHLAAALGRYPGDHVAAFRLYKDRLRPFVEAVEDRAAIDGMSMICPADEGELAERDREISASGIGFKAMRDPMVHLALQTQDGAMRSIL